ncbi:neuromodulin [Xyrauchen texanus]|uniref:neuromodulin n=1 Tax=Xyrauchen texanus TaxID=154827 RepID=UPI00224256C7|nr:neuromodulin [Xyrauchen texanus]
MLCCIRRTKPVEKNEEADQEIKQDGIKPEENAHKAATKIQASFRGHITRKKMKDGEKEENGAVPEESAETTEGDDKKERISPSEEKPPEVSTETAEKNKPAKSPAAEQPNSPAAEVPPTVTADPTPSDTPAKEDVKEQPQEVEKPKEPESASDAVAEKPAEEPAVNAQNEEEENEEAKQAHVPDDAESRETDQIDQKEAVDDSKPADEAVSDAGKEENI